MSDAGQIREQVPAGARLFPLIPNTKRPTEEGAHHNAVAVEQFLELFISGNYGIALDGQYLLVDQDRDSDAASAFVAQLPETWTQKTWKRGTHRVYVTPEHFVGGNGVWPGGELKVNGYLVGPGSVVREGALTGEYVMLDTRAPVPAPQWLLDMVRRDRATPGDASRIDVELDTIADGTRDNELAAIAGFMRRRGYTEQVLSSALLGIVESGVVEQPPGREVTPDDCARIARSIAKKPPGERNDGPGAISAADWLCGADVAIVGPVVEWWERGFFPKADLVTLFGKSGAGKSSLGSWAAARVTSAGAPFLFVGVEEPFTRFLGRAVLCEPPADRAKLFALQHAGRLQLPRDVGVLREQVRLAGVKMIWFDSIFSHFEHRQGENIAERARRCLSPLAEMAQEEGVTVVGVFHENKAGDYLGSVEMVNLARVTLQAARTKGQPMTLEVHTTNLWEPDYALVFDAPEIPLHDPLTGDVQQEIGDDGALREMMVRVPVLSTRRELGVRVGDLDAVEGENGDV